MMRPTNYVQFVDEEGNDLLPAFENSPVPHENQQVNITQGIMSSRDLGWHTVMQVKWYARPTSLAAIVVVRPLKP